MSIVPGAGYVEHAARTYAKALHPAATYHPGRLAQEARIVQAAAEKYDINPAIEWGIYGAETKHGQDVHTSSTGAVGPFQFEPATAAKYGYPTNVNVNGVTNMGAFKKQAEATARYLASLLPGGKGEHGVKPGAGWNQAWEQAIAHYSGGGYNLSHVKQEAKSFPYAAQYGVQAEDESEHEQVEKNPTEEGSIWSKLGEFSITAVLLIAGVVLLIYGVMVAVRPRENALSIPRPSFA